MMFSDEERALLARTVAALRRDGWPAHEAIACVAADLGERDAGRALARVAETLRRGEAPSESDPLLALLAHGDAAGPDALDESAVAIDVAREARHVALSGLLYPVAILVFSGGLLFGLHWMAGAYERMFVESDLRLPAPTVLVLDIAYLLPPVVIACFVAAAALLALRRHAARWVPGVRGLLAASRLRAYAAAIDSARTPADALRWAAVTGRDVFEARELRLDDREASLGARLRELEGDARAARRLATEMEISARRTARIARRWLPAAFLLAGLVFGGLVVVALYLPIFSMANTWS